MDYSSNRRNLEARPYFRGGIPNAAPTAASIIQHEYEYDQVFYTDEKSMHRTMSVDIPGYESKETTV